MIESILMLLLVDLNI